MLGQLSQSFLILLKLVIPLHSSKDRGTVALTEIASNLAKNLLVDLKFNSLEPTGRLFHNKQIFTDPHLFTSSYYFTWNL